MIDNDIALDFRDWTIVSLTDPDVHIPDPDSDLELWTEPVPERTLAVHLTHTEKWLSKTLDMLQATFSAAAQRILRAGVVHMCLMLDGTEFAHFKGDITKLEQIVMKLLIPGLHGSAQQSFKSCMPLAFMQGNAVLHSSRSKHSMLRPIRNTPTVQEQRRPHCWRNSLNT